MSTIEKSTLFPPVLVKEMFSKVKGHSSIVALSGQTPMPFNGKDVFTFDFSNQVSIVGESAAKPAGGAAVTAVQIRPVKVVYQSRISDEFLKASDEVQLNFLRTYADGMAKHMGKALDVMSFHGVNPATGAASDIIGNNHFDYAIPAGNVIVLGHDSTDIATNIEEAIGKVEDTENVITGVVMAPAARTLMASLKDDDGKKIYPEFAFGGAPDKLGNGDLDINATVSANSNNDRVIVGDFENAFMWGFAEEVPLEIIEYGNPDGGTYDLKQANQILLRSEAYVGWGILDGSNFAKVEVGTEEDEEEDENEDP